MSQPPFLSRPRNGGRPFRADVVVVAGVHAAQRHAQAARLAAEAGARLVAAGAWGEGFETTAYLGATLLDLAWHSLPAGTVIEDPLAFEAAALADFLEQPRRHAAAEQAGEQQRQ